MARSDDTIEMSALGRPFQLGMLYDCRKEILIPGITLWDLDTLRTDVDVKPQSKTEFQIIASDTIDAKASALNVTASLKASFFSGLVEVEGSAEYLEDTKTSRHQARVTLQYSTTTQFKQLTMSHIGRQNVSYPDVFDQGTATHVVTAVLYGAQAFFVFDREVSSSENIQEIQGKLQVMINKIPTITIQGKGSLKMDEQEKHQAEKFSCRFYGDFALENNPVTYEDAMKVYATLPKLLGDNGEKAVPVRVWLYPLTKLDSKAARLVREISLTLIFDAQAVLEQLAEVDMRCNDLMKNRIATTFPEIRRKLQQFQDLCKQHRQIFQKELAGLLPSIRGGGREEGALVDILTCKNQSPFNTQQLNEFLENKEREVNFVSSYLSALKDVEVVSSKNKVEEIVLDPKNEFVVSFTFTSLQDEEPYLSDLKLWLQTEYMKNTHDPAPASRVSEKPKSKLWFEDKERNQNARKSAKSLSEFARINKSRGKTRFLVASTSDEDNPGASIYLYEDGELVSTNFEPPAKPLPPLIAGISHDRVQLTLKPAARGEAAITGYRGECRRGGQEDWTIMNVNSKQETFPVAGLRANTEYQFRYAAVSKPGLSATSDGSDRVKTLPTSPPGKPGKTAVASSAIALRWTNPNVIGEGVTIREYRVEYKEDTGGTSPEEKGKWQEQRTKKKAESCSIEGLKPGTSYVLRVSAVCVDGAVSDSSEEVSMSDPSEEVSFSTLGAESKSLAYEYMKKSTQIGGQEPSVYALPIEEVACDSSSSYLKYRLGVESSHPHKVIMVMGATGSGKTTLINGMINYILGVQWKDDFRFKLIHEVTNRSQAESQTSEVTAYEVNYRQGFKILYSLTIIDTPGFGDTRGIEQDKLITKQIREFFSTPGGIDQIDAVCVVVQASLARLTHAQKYVFDSVLSIFGKDIKDNIQVLVTFADGQTPPVLEAIKTADVPCAKDAKGTPIHFKFNNSTLYASNAGADDGSFSFDAMFWKMGAMSMKTFFDSLFKLESRSLTLTKEVLRERKELEAAVEGLQPQIRAGLTKLEELRKTKKILEQHKDEMEANKDFQYEVEVTVPVKEDISGTGNYITNCQRCYYTCHHPCGIPNDDGKRGCAAIDQSTGYCTVCPGKCFWNVHYNQKYKWNYEPRKEKRTFNELKEKYEKASGEILSTKNVVEKLSQEYAAVEEILLELIDKSSYSLQRLQKIALKPNPLSTPEYIDLLIMSEQQELKPGYQERIKSLNKVREIADIIRKIANKEPLLPGEEDMYRKKKEKQSSFKTFVKDKVNLVKSFFQ
ncbi:uncharacterized protein LOC102383910 [Alligator sinensis]|uniref:Uncharacterized protein LOC102383910 n=1 Tax=Alligator sinensis TaxID=38654 RepID=A0A1U7SXA4_ALLSI|nr:uncharacterized protein LOC102383910 [Alligator sinensis]XP_025050595.1 uncharacterized protein LOC102383910 [Alligator sinensis]